MNLLILIETIKKHPDYEKAGMLMCQNGFVRSTSRAGRKVSGLKTKVDHEKLQQVIKKYKNKPEVTEIQVQINENRILSVGDDVMFLVVAGDVRENVIPVLNATLNAIKTTATKKKEFFYTGVVV